MMLLTEACSVFYSNKMCVLKIILQCYS